MESIKLWARNGEAVRQAIELGEIAHIETAREELTDAFRVLAIESGLLKSWAGSLPDPRCEPEMAMEVIGPAHLAARFAGLYAMRNAGYVLRSARVLGALGYSVEVMDPEHGVSGRGTSDDTLFRGDVVRNLLVQMEQPADLSQPARRPPPEPSVAVKVRERAARRAVKHAVDEAEAEARAHQVAEPLADWYNQHGGGAMLQYARLGRGRRRHILDTTHVEGPIETGTYECSGVVKNEDGTLARGYKLATLRTLLDRAGLRTQVAMSALQVHAGALCRPVLAEAPGVRAGALLLEARGFLDGATLSAWKHKRQVEVSLPLQATRLATQEALHRAAMADQWQAHPARAEPTMTLVRGVEQMWTACEVPLNAWVIRFWNKKKKRPDHIVLVTTDLRLSASWIVRPSEARPEIEQDYEQRKSGGWQLKQLSATRYSEIVFDVLTVVLSSSLYHLLANTQAGARFADKTRQAIAFEQLRTPRTPILV
jgi:hypothetical protein